MAETFQKNNFSLLFCKQQHIISLEYELNQNIVAQNWFKKIKHLQAIPISKIESKELDTSNFDYLHKKFCEFINMEYVPVKIFNQENLNYLHSLYETAHENYSKKSNNDILYEFHLAIHKKEKLANDWYWIGWGTQEGLLESTFDCNKFYESDLKKNNLYLPWSELGKTPLKYWQNKEPNNQDRFNELAKPHKALRALFVIQLHDRLLKALPIEFTDWFKTFKESWLQHYKIGNWSEIDEFGAVLLATAKHEIDIIDLIQKGYQFHKITTHQRR